MRPTDSDGNEIPCRVIFARNVVPGTTLVVKCYGESYCNFGDDHASNVWHRLTFTGVIVASGLLNGIAVDESGNQVPYQVADYLPCYVEIQMNIPNDATMSTVRDG